MLEADHWGGYGYERRALATLFKEVGVPLVVVSGDAHTVAIDDGRNADYAPGGGAPIPAIQTGALAATGKQKGGLGPFSHGRQPNRNDAKGISIGDGQFVTMDVTDYGGSRICLDVQGWRVEGPTERLVRLRREWPGRSGAVVALGTAAGPPRPSPMSWSDASCCPSASAAESRSGSRHATQPLERSSPGRKPRPASVAGSALPGDPPCASEGANARDWSPPDPKETPGPGRGLRHPALWARRRVAVAQLQYGLAQGVDQA